MGTLFIILSIICWAGSLFLLFRKQLVAPALSYLGLLLLSFARTGDIPYVPINNTILIGWLCMTLVVMLATMLQPPAITAQTRGEGYMLGGALTGMAIGLLGFTFTSSLPLLYGIMIVGTLAGVFFGYLLFTNTPHGAAVGLRSGRFFTYLPAKGFPTAVTVMQIGVALVILVARNAMR